MHKLKYFIFILTCSIVTLFVFTACGNKGPLYLPESEAQPINMSPTTPPAAATIKDDTEE
ncbi:LPS translocon maturation chaperone LptM [Nitrosomonas marina]|uniref:LPS translocon maturation chaperone LptM n=1 Tax=Nitrosomonas marina TaxID=917 RepID=UPI000A45DB34|nr:lipoprotein [Nitrosomonas marina]